MSEIPQGCTLLPMLLESAVIPEPQCEGQLAPFAPRWGCREEAVSFSISISAEADVDCGAVAPAAEKEALDHPPGLGKRTVEDDHVDEKDVDRQGERTVHNAELLFYSCGECERGK